MSKLLSLPPQQQTAHLKKLQFERECTEIACRGHLITLMQCIWLVNSHGEVEVRSRGQLGEPEGHGGAVL